MRTSLLKIAPDTFTNESGLVLKNYLVSKIQMGETVILSFEGARGLSSSFLNSSFGELIQSFGLMKIKQAIKLVDLTTSQAKSLKEYFISFDKVV